MNYCIRIGVHDIAEMLIKNGAGPIPTMHYIFEHFNTYDSIRKFVEFLLEHGANINAVSFDNFSNLSCSPLDLAIISERGEDKIEL